MRTTNLSTQFATASSPWLHSASWILHARRRPARISKLMNQKSKMHYFARIRWYPSIGDVQSCILSFIFATHFFFAVESSHTTIIENSHAIMIFFYADLEFDIDHDTRSSVQMSQPLRWFVKYPYVLFLPTVVLSVAGASAKWVYPPFTQYIKGVPRHNLNLSITCIMRPANHATAVKRSTPQALGYRACLFKDRHGLSSPTSHVSWDSMCGPAQQQVIVIYCSRQRCIIFSSTTRYPRYHRTTTGIAHCIQHFASSLCMYVL